MTHADTSPYGLSPPHPLGNGWGAEVVLGSDVRGV